MGQLETGEIDSHLEVTKAAVTKWYEYEDPIPVNGLDAALNALSTENLEPPDQPEILKDYRLSRRFNVPLFNGSYHQWPYIFCLELNACIDAINEYETMKLVNLNMALNHKANK